MSQPTPETYLCILWHGLAYFGMYWIKLGLLYENIWRVEESLHVFRKWLCIQSPLYSSYSIVYLPPEQSMVIEAEYEERALMMDTSRYMAWHRPLFTHIDKWCSYFYHLSYIYIVRIRTTLTVRKGCSKRRRLQLQDPCIRLSDECTQYDTWHTCVFNALRWLTD